MTFRPHPADEGLLSWLERWAPADAELWARWRQSLSAEQRGEGLLPLQAALSGLMAFRHLENHPPSSPEVDFRPHLHAMQVSCSWALDLARALDAHDGAESRLQTVGAAGTEPSASLHRLVQSLQDALRVGERILDLPGVDADAFAASCELFLRDLSRNPFFRPSEPLEFSNVADLVGTERFPPHLASLAEGAEKATMIIAFLSLLRSHRFLGIADGQMTEHDGIYRAHVVLAGARRELRTLTRFLLVQGGEAVEALAMDVHQLVQTELGEGLPDAEDLGGLAAASERMRNGIRAVRRAVKESARNLRDLSSPRVQERTERTSERVAKDLRPEIWSFRFIVRAFIAKASAVPLSVDGAYAPEDLGFAAEFVRHFRVFAPRLAKGTDYGRRAPMVRAVSALSRRDDVDRATLGSAVDECARFAEHLDRALEKLQGSLEASFDKEHAASELRDYLSAARDRFSSGPAPAGAFGLGRVEEAEAS